MLIKLRNAGITAICCLTFGVAAVTNAQDMPVVDEVAAVVGGNIIKKSDIQRQYMQYLSQGYVETSNIKCILFEELLFAKLLLNQAQTDSLVVSNEQVEGEMDRRMRFFISQFGSQEKMELYYGKTTRELKAELRTNIREQLLEDQVRNTITADIQVSPAEVKAYFKELPEDSIPTIPSEVEFAHLVKRPVISEKEKLEAWEKLNALRERVLSGEKLSTLAILYSEDPGSAKQGGELGYYEKGVFHKEFEAAAFKLKDGQVSEIVETKDGYHILQLVGRKGELVNVRHILIRPKINPNDLQKARETLVGLAALIASDSISFEDAALKHSDDENKMNGGLVVNPQTGNTTFFVDQLDPSLFFTIDKLKPGAISVPVPMKNEDGQDAFRIIQLKSRTNPHRANIKDDYAKIQDAALQHKKMVAIDDWVKNKISKTYIHLGENYRLCDFQHNWEN